MSVIARWSARSKLASPGVRSLAHWRKPKKPVQQVAHTILFSAQCGLDACECLIFFIIVAVMGNRTWVGFFATLPLFVPISISLMKGV